MIYGIINSVVRGKEECIDIQIYDIEKAFDGLWLEDCLNDVYDSLPQGKRDDKLSLLYEANKKNMVAVKTAVGMTDRIDSPNIVQQGGTWARGCAPIVLIFWAKNVGTKTNIFIFTRILPRY